MYACMYAWMYVCTYVRMYACMYAWMYACMYVCMYTHVCKKIYVCIYIYILCGYVILINTIHIWLVVGPPLWKIISQWGWLATQYMGKSHWWQPTHQPAIHYKVNDFSHFPMEKGRFPIAFPIVSLSLTRICNMYYSWHHIYGGFLSHRGTPKKTSSSIQYNLVICIILDIIPATAWPQRPHFFHRRRAQSSQARPRSESTAIDCRSSKDKDLGRSVRSGSFKRLKGTPQTIGKP